ncbi:hypothetical protein ED733_003057 [Metarhizium rileyi]|uniref:MARVEL-like domain protein n=1 Tax=Metarhizium rileyi (strain RCEF 4871) TaxID=1649241 RepID=A0A5C6G594_METRR|nr:hypothetical protein ED733_003057 [Metarhizium rileyi]
MACVTMMWALVTLLLAWLQPSLYTTPARLVDFLLGTTLIASVAVVLSSNYEMNGTGGLIGWLFFAGFASGILSLVSAALPLLDSTARYLERRRMAQR